MSPKPKRQLKDRKKRIDGIHSREMKTETTNFKNIVQDQRRSAISKIFKIRGFIMGEVLNSLM